MTRLRATLPVTVQVPPGRAYEYYRPELEDRSRPVVIEVER